MKRKIAFILSIALAVSLVFTLGISMASAATADAQGIAFVVSMDNRNYANGDPMKPVLTVGNTGATDIAVTNITCNGTQVAGASTVPAGKQLQTQPTINAAFASGSKTEALNFVLTYTQNGSTFTNTAGIQVNLADVLKLTTSDSVSSKSINAGDKPTFTFKITNSGNVAVTNISLKAPPLNSGNVIGTPFSLNPGDSKTMTWQEGINNTISVKPVLSYTASDTNKTQNMDSISVTVKQVANSGMNVDLKSDKDNVNAGDQINITATVTNTGNDTLKSIKLLDGNNNPVTLQVTTLNAGQSTTATIPETLQATANYQFTATATNSASSAVNATSNQLTVTVGGGASSSPSSSGSGTDTSAVPATLGITVVADSYTLDKPGNVKFQVTVENTSDVVLTNVSVTEKTIGDFGSVSSLGKDSKVFNKSVEVDKSSQYIFTVTATQPDGKSVTAVTQPLSITVTGGALFGGDMMTTILIIVIIAIAVVGLILFLLYRRNRSGGGSYGGGSNRSAYTPQRKPASYNNANTNNTRDVEPPKVVRKPVSAPPKPPVRKDTKFGDRNKF